LGSLPDESVQRAADGNLEGARLLLGWQWLPPYGCMVVRSLSMTTQLTFYAPKSGPQA